MKKIVLSIAAVMAAAAFAPEASAVPVFARQTGMACTACHFQHFPLLNGFGRAFKAAGFTMMGAQGKIEGEHLSIPDTLNFGVLTSAFYEKRSGTATGKGVWGVPGNGGEFSLFVGGRIAEFAGFLSEIGVAGGAAAGTSGLGAAKLALLFPVGDSRAGIVTYTGNQGAAYGFELLNTGAADTHKMMGNPGANKEHAAAAYAGSYMGTRSLATGVNAVFVNPNIGYVSLGKYAPADTTVTANGGASNLPLTYLRGVYMFDVAGFDSAVGIQNFSGSDSVTLTGDYKATMIDAQFQGEVGGMETGLYVTYASAPASTALALNKMNAGWSTVTKAGNAPAAAAVAAKSTSINVAGSLEIIPGVATLQAAIRRATNGNYANTADNAVMIGGTYELAQNIELALNYTSNSGSVWNGIVAPVGKNTTTLLLESLF